MAKRFSHTTKTNRNGLRHSIIIEDHGSDGFMGQLVTGPPADPNDLRSETIVLDHFDTIERACDAIGYPHDIVGIPVLK